MHILEQLKNVKTLEELTELFNKCNSDQRNELFDVLTEEYMESISESEEELKEFFQSLDPVDRDNQFAKVTPEYIMSLSYNDFTTLVVGAREAYVKTTDKIGMDNIERCEPYFKEYIETKAKERVFAFVTAVFFSSLTNGVLMRGIPENITRFLSKMLDPAPIDTHEVSQISSTRLRK